MTNVKNVVTAEQMRKKKFEFDLKRPYDSILKEAEGKSNEAIAKAKHITLEYYIPLLCERLRVERFKDIDIETSEIQDIKKMKDDIRTQVVNDCYWWEYESIRHYWPTWAKDEFLTDLRKAEAQHRRPKFTEKVSVKEQESNELAQNEFNMLSSVMQRVKTPTPVKSQEPRGFGPAIPTEDEPATPQELYEDAIRAIAQLWTAMTNKDTLPTKMEDVFNDCIKPSRKFRQRIIKGLDEARAAHFHNSLVWLGQLLDDTLQMMDEIQKESDDNPLKNVHGEIEK